MHRFHHAAAVCLAACLLFVIGCQSQPVSGNLAYASEAYGRGQYERAYEWALQARDQHRGVRRDEAALLAGLSAGKLNRNRQAEQYLSQASHSSDISLSGQALASLGLLYAREERYPASAHTLLDAAELLKGQDRANAFFYAAIAQQKLGRWPQARTNLYLARGTSSDAAFIKRVNAQLAVTGYTVQLGAYSTEDNARDAAKKVAREAVTLHYGSPRLVPQTSPDGERLWVVRVGRFATYQTADAARDKLSANRAIIVPLASAD